uniref:VWFA domain-containing protein n=1 Tax=Physcomitrium patens TaxID=3218 RepID=A0A7I4CCG0_PHYPA
MPDHGRLVALFFIFSLISCPVHALTELERAKSMLLQKETDLSILVSQVQKNHDAVQQNCDSLKNCGEGPACSRLSCFSYSGTSRLDDYKCHHVYNNSFCPVGGGPCQYRNFDFSQSFCRRVVDDPGSRQSICAQKKLHNYMTKMSNDTHFFQAYYGAIDGSFRYFPGADEVSCEQIYDPRIRPWFRESIHAKKSVVVLINTGSTMTDNINAQNFTLLDKVKEKLSSTFPRTLSGKDKITFMTFNYSGSYRLNPDPYVVGSDANTPNGDSTVEKLKNIVYTPDLGISLTDPTEVNATNSINGAIDLLSKDDPQYFKVILMFTTGSVRIPPNITLDSSVRLFIYNLDTGSNQSPNECSVDRVHFEDLNYVAFDKNILFALRAYFSWFGNIHRLIMNSSKDYSEQYSDYSGVDVNTFTLSVPVFALTGNQLLGVVGVDIFKTETANDYGFRDPTTLTAAVTGRYNQSTSTSDGYDASTMINVPSVCYTPYTICADSIIDENNICLPNPENHDMKVSCCGACSPKKNSLPIRLIAGLTAGGVITIAFLACLCCFCQRQIEEKKRNKAIRDIRIFEPPAGAGARSTGTEDPPTGTAPHSRRHAAAAITSET